MAWSFEWCVADDALIEQDAHRVDIRRLVLMFDVTQCQFGCSIFRFSHEGSSHGQSLVIGREQVHLLGNTEVDELDMSFAREHDVGWVNIAVYIPRIVQRHQARKHTHDDGLCKM